MSDEQTKWLDAPDSEGCHWLATNGAGWELHVVSVCLKRKLCWDTYKPGCPEGTPISAYRYWMRAPEKPMPLPRSKQVTLTAQVYVPRYGGNWSSRVEVLGKCIADVNCSGSKEAAIKWVRDNYGIEPEIVEAPAPEGEKR